MIEREDLETDAVFPALRYVVGSKQILKDGRMIFRLTGSRRAEIFVCSMKPYHEHTISVGNLSDSGGNATTPLTSHDAPEDRFKVILHYVSMIEFL